MIRINTEIIAQYRPCKDRFDNWKKEYPNFDGDFDDFLDLEKITYSDKIWVAKRVLNINQRVHWAVLCAESVLPIFEVKHPKESAVRDCLNFLKSIVDYGALTSEQRSMILEHRAKARNAADAADAAAYAAYAAASAASAAAYAAYAADAAAYAAASAAYDAAASAAYAAAAAAADAAAAAASASASAAARQRQHNLNLTFLKRAASL